MILLRNNLVNVNIFLKKLPKVVEGVLRISIVSPTPQICTGWLLTKKLVVIPDYIEGGNDAFLCYPNSGSGKPLKPVKGKLVYKQRGNEEGNTAALLELNIPLIYEKQTLQTENCAPGDSIIIVQHTGESPYASLSFGNVTSVEDPWLYYDADTQTGSSGSPIVNIQTGKILGMHVKSGGSNQKVNIGLTINKILETLKDSPYWKDISKSHKLADTSPFPLENYSGILTSHWTDIHLKAALNWSLNKSSLSKKEQEQLKPYIIDTFSSQWIMKPSDRQKILQSKPIAELRKFKQKDLTTQKDQKFAIGQKVIDRIIKGGPYKIDEVEETELPYWIQAVRWFAPLDDALPSAADVNRTLERKRIRSQLATLGGNDFKGRVTEIKRLEEWYEKNIGLIMVTGIGGIGKSALISHFALRLSEETPLLRLDFDSPQIAPDDALSVLKSLSEQVTTQVDHFISPEPAKDWETMAVQFGENLSKVLTGLPAPLLVLDGFEVAQHVKHYQEIWKLLELVLSKCPNIRIIVSGRSTVPSLSLRGKAPADTILLKGMEPKDAEALLAQYKIRNKDVVKKVVELSKGIPLILKLAIHFIDKGGRINELPDNLPRELVEGYLYQRILDRVIDINLRSISSKALILRKLTVDIIDKILPEYVPKGSNAEETYEGLSREMGLITENDSLTSVFVTVSTEAGVLQLRPELRTAIIKLLEIENPASVKEIDQRAVNYYLSQELLNFDNRAELIYHLLRLGRIDEADQYWQTECAPLLKYAGEDLAESSPAAQNWLNERIRQVITETRDDIKIWELGAVNQILNMLSRGYFRGVSEILKQRSERSKDSPLLSYDAWMAWNGGEREKALRLLQASEATNVSVQRDQKILQALLEVQNGNQIKADAILSSIETKTLNERKDGKNEELALRAARCRLTVSLDLELEIANAVRVPVDDYEVSFPFLKSRLYARDVVLPFLAENISEKWLLESVGSGFTIPVNETDLNSFSERLTGGPNAKSFSTELDLTAKNLEELYDGNILNMATTVWDKKVRQLVLQGEYRWAQARSSLVLADFAKSAVNKEDGIEPLRLSILSTLVAFRGLEIGVSIGGYREPTIDSFLKSVIRKNFQSIVPPLSTRRKILFESYLKQEMQFNPSHDVERALTQLKTDSILPVETDSSNLDQSMKFILEFREEELVSMILFLFGPDPLEMLCRRVLGLPDNFKFQ